jgi:hypothetical protein
VGRIVEETTKMITQFECEIKVYRPTQNKKKSQAEEPMKSINLQRVNDRAIVKIKWISQLRLMCVRRDGMVNYLKWWSTGISTTQPVPNMVPFQCGLEREKQHVFDRIGDPFSHLDKTVSLTSFPLEILCFGKVLFYS